MTQDRLQWYYDNEKKFSEEGRTYIHNLLETADDAQFSQIKKMKIKDPSVTQVLSIFAFPFAASRFYLKSYAVGVIELCTLGALCILYLLDAFTAKTRTYKYNNKLVLEVLDSATANSVYAHDMQKMQEGMAKTGKAIKIADKFINRDKSDLEVNIGG